MSFGVSESGTYVVVVNDDQQYSIWPEGKDVPPGWHFVARAHSRQECLDHIGRIWTDMRPLGLRRKMADAGSAAEPPERGVGGLDGRTVA